MSSKFLRNITWPNLSFSFGKCHPGAGLCRPLSLTLALHGGFSLGFLVPGLSRDWEVFPEAASGRFLVPQRWQGSEPLPAFAMEAATGSCKLIMPLTENPENTEFFLCARRGLCERKSRDSRKPMPTTIGIGFGIGSGIIQAATGSCNLRPLRPRRFFSVFLVPKRWQGSEPLPAFAMEAATGSCKLSGFPVLKVSESQSRKVPTPETKPIFAPFLACLRAKNSSGGCCGISGTLVALQLILMGATNPRLVQAF